MITATHDLETLEDIADRCYVLENGQIAGEGTPLAILHDWIYSRPRSHSPQHHVHKTEVSHPHSHLHLSDLS